MTAERDAKAALYCAIRSSSSDGVDEVPIAEAVQVLCQNVALAVVLEHLLRGRPSSSAMYITGSRSDSGGFEQGQAVGERLIDRQLMRPQIALGSSARRRSVRGFRSVRCRPRARFL